MSTGETMNLNRSTRIGLVLTDQSSFVSIRTNRRAHGLWQEMSQKRSEHPEYRIWSRCYILPST